MTIHILLVVAVVWLAWSNGANDNFIGVATLYGSRTCTYRAALIWATLATAAGAAVSISFAHLLVARFSGAGLMDEAVIGLPLLAAVAGAAAITKWLATRLGMPASTTQVSCGAIFAIGLANGRCHWVTIAQIAAAWVVTLPMGLVLGAGLMWLLA